MLNDVRYRNKTDIIINGCYLNPQRRGCMLRCGNCVCSNYNKYESRVYVNTSTLLNTDVNPLNSIQPCCSPFSVKLSYLFSASKPKESKCFCGLTRRHVEVNTDMPFHGLGVHLKRVMSTGSCFMEKANQLRS